MNAPFNFAVYKFRKVVIGPGDFGSQKIAVQIV